jgi:hypothetical protein
MSVTKCELSDHKNEYVNKFPVECVKFGTDWHTFIKGRSKRVMFHLHWH